MTNALRSVILRFDDFLSRNEGIFIFNPSPDCILRLQVGKAPHAMTLGECMITKDQPVLGIHLWNNHLPPLSTTGPNLTWAVRTQRLFVGSLHLAAATVKDDSRLARLGAIFAVTSLFVPQTGPSKIHPMARLGFTITPYHSPLGGFGEFWENFYALWLIWAYNPGSAPARRLFSLRRSEMWMRMEDFLERYG
jgi:hypothetical protein